MFKSIWMKPAILYQKRYNFLLTDDDFYDWCECEVLYKDTITEGALANQFYDSSARIIAETKVIIRIYTQRQGNIAKNIWLYFRKLEKEDKYNMKNLIKINKELNPSYAYHEKEVDMLVEKYAVLS
jgi:hypothetical protein